MKLAEVDKLCFEFSRHGMFWAGIINRIDWSNRKAYVNITNDLVKDWLKTGETSAEDIEVSIDWMLFRTAQVSPKTTSELAKMLWDRYGTKENE